MWVDAYTHLRRQDDFMRIVGALLAKAQTIEEHTGWKPTAMVLPESVMPVVTRIGGTPVVRGDKPGLLYDLDGSV